MIAILPVISLINGPLQASADNGLPCGFSPTVPSSANIIGASTKVFGIKKSGVDQSPPAGSAHSKAKLLAIASGDTPLTTTCDVAANANTTPIKDSISFFIKN